MTSHGERAVKQKDVDQNFKQYLVNVQNSPHI